MKRLERMSRALAVVLLLGAVRSQGQVRPRPLPEPPPIPWKEVTASLDLPGKVIQMED